MQIRRPPYRFVVISLALTAMAVVLWWPGLANANPVTHELSIDAADFAYTPGRIEVRQGDHVTITLTASDVVHGFALDGHDIKVRVTPGVSERIVFTADEAGKFRFRCSVSCGALHPFMIGELVVTPNNPFWKAAAIALIGMALMFVHLWNTGKATS
jgi:heme/copper-type cytochrome/quinol oxidase subunit 2